MKLSFLASLGERQNDEWKIRYIDEGEVAGRGWCIFERGLRASLPRFANVWVQSLRFEGGKHDHLPSDVRAVFPSGVITDNIIGMASRPELEQIGGKWALTGWFRPATEKMNTLLAMASEAGKLSEFGLSINGDVLDETHVTSHRLASGTVLDEILEIDKLYSTDMVTYPGRGGGFQEMLASAGFTTHPQQQRGSGMTLKERLIALLRQQGIAFKDAPAPLGILASVGIVAADGNTPEGEMSEGDQKVLESIYAALTAGLDEVAAKIMDAVMGKPTPDPSPEGNAPVQASVGNGQEPTPGPSQEGNFQEGQGQLPEWQVNGGVVYTKMLVRTLLDDEAGLSESIKTLVASRFEGQVATEADVRAVIEEYKKVVSLSSDTGHAKHYTASTQMGMGYMAGGAVPNTKIQQACDQLFGVVPSKFQASLRHLEQQQGITPEESFHRYGVMASAEIPSRYTEPRIGLRDLYVELTGDSLINFDFMSPRGRKRLLEASTVKQTTLPYAVGVSLNRRLVQDWVPKELPWRKVSKVKSDGLKDFRPQEIIRISGWAEWRTVAEGASYLELDVPTEVKETYTPLKKGELLPITREMIMRDDVRLVDTMLMKFRNAGKNTFDKAFWRKFVNYETAAVNDGTMGDGNPVYDAVNHSNLLDAAITHPNMLALKRLIRAQKEQGSDIWLQLQGKYVVYPLSLEDDQLVYIVSEKVPNDIINNANILRIKEENALCIDDGLLESSDYVYMSVDPTEHPTLEVGFINNQQVPEMFVQDDPTQGNAFLKDIFTWKGRLEFGIGWEDFRGVARVGTT